MTFNSLDYIVSNAWGGKKLSIVLLGHPSLSTSSLAVETTALSRNGLQHTVHPLTWHHIPEEQRPPLC